MRSSLRFPGSSPRACALFLGLLQSLVGVGCGNGVTDGSGGGAASTNASTGVGACAGGVIVDGECVGQCTPDKCVQPPAGETWSNTCVSNTCKLVCDSHGDCLADGTQDCGPATDDASGASVDVCQSNGKIAGIGADCHNGNECDASFACPSGEPCGTSNCGGDAAACTIDAEACRKVGADGTFSIDPACKKGRCAAPDTPYDGATCHVGDACPANECMPLRCATAGPGDAYAYCTRDHCDADADCPGGYFCGITRDPRQICGSSPAKGDNNFCGKTSEDCVDPSTFTADGASFLEGSLCLLKRSCIKRAACAPCETDLDCSLTSGQKCVQIGATKNCASTCGTSKDCQADAECTNGSCVPRFGACKAPPATFCAPCLSDEDCGSNGTTWACAELSGGMRACFDEAFPDLCTTDADCPTSASGKHGSCLDEEEGLAPGDSIYQHCYLPIDLASNKTSCW